jgi:sugar/nucleoside kinase (ribokinase family)
MVINKFKPQVAALGTCNIDFLMKVPRFSRADDEVDVEDLKIFLGGSASNFALNISRMGVNVGIIARIGDDEYGQFASTKFLQEGVNIDRLVEISDITGMAFIAVDKDGERSIYTVMGANAQFKLERSDIKYIKNAQILHLTGMYLEVVEEASKHAHYLSLSPGTSLASYGMDCLNKILKRTNILFLNRREVALLTGEEYKTGTRKLVEFGVDQVVVTCGRQGACLYTPDGIINSPTHPINSLDTTGAGDAFAAGFIAGLVKNKKPEKCLQMGNELASSCVEMLGAVDLGHYQI